MLIFSSVSSAKQHGFFPLSTDSETGLVIVQGDKASQASPGLREKVLALAVPDPSPEGTEDENQAFSWPQGIAGGILG